MRPFKIYWSWVKPVLLHCCRVQIHARSQSKWVKIVVWYIVSNISFDTKSFALFSAPTLEISLLVAELMVEDHCKYGSRVTPRYLKEVTCPYAFSTSFFDNTFPEFWSVSEQHCLYLLRVQREFGHWSTPFLNAFLIIVMHTCLDCITRVRSGFSKAEKRKRREKGTVHNTCLNIKVTLPDYDFWLDILIKISYYYGFPLMFENKCWPCSLIKVNSNLSFILLLIAQPYGLTPGFSWVQSQQY